jgi:ribose/xylose/arabinose/galactoside ABC-type transport system permease subunit
MTVDVSNTGYQLEMDAILAVVIGGTSLAGGKFNITGAAIGALLIATLDKTVVFLGISSSATPAFKAIVIIALCLLQSAAGPWRCSARGSAKAAPATSRRTEGGRRSMSAAITTPPAAPTTSRLERLRQQLLSRADSLPTAAALLIFVLMLAYGEIAYGRIFQLSTVSNLFINNAHLIILAVGLTFVIISGGIDLSVGAIIALSSVSGVILANAGWNAWLVNLVMILIGSHHRARLRAC